MGSVISAGTLPTLPAFQDASGNVLGIHIFGEVQLSYPSLLEMHDERDFEYAELEPDMYGINNRNL